MDRKRIIIPTAIIGLMIIIIAGGFIISNFCENKNFKNTSFDNISESASEASWIPINSFDPSLCKPAKFKVGERYKYSLYVHSREIGVEGDDGNGFLILGQNNYTIEIYVDGIERINKTDYYVIKEKNGTVFEKFRIKDEKGVWRDKTSESPMNTGGCIVKISEDDSSLIIVPQVNTMCKGFDYFIIYWERYLPSCINRGTHFVVGGERVDQYVPGGVANVLEFEVTDLEKIKGRDCFKLEMTEKETYKNMAKITNRIIFWIDAEKRITLKAKRYEGNILTEEIELIE